MKIEEQVKSWLRHAKERKKLHQKKYWKCLINKCVVIMIIILQYIINYSNL